MPLLLVAQTKRHYFRSDVHPSVWQVVKDAEVTIDDDDAETSAAALPSFPNLLFYNGYLATEAKYTEDQCAAHLRPRIPQLRVALKALGVTAFTSKYGDYQVLHLLRALLERDVYRPRINLLLSLSKKERGDAVAKWSDLPEDVVPLTTHFLTKNSSTG